MSSLLLPVLLHVQVEPMPPTFRILDERRPMLYLPNVAFDPSVRFFKDFPKV